MYKLECWSICPSSDSAPSVFRPPEAQGIAVQAKKSTRPDFEDGILTTRIINIQGRVVTTRSGTVYLLGEPDPDYVKWCLEHGHHDPRDHANPIKAMT
jgi:hypothetical protein